MKNKIAGIIFLCAVSVAASPALTWNAGGILGGGLDFAGGSYFDARAQSLTLLGSTTPGVPGTSAVQLFPGATAGGYVELEALEWLSVRVEPRVSFLGGMYMAYTDTGAPFDRYGAYTAALILPVYARFIIPLGPGAVSISAGGFCAAAPAGSVLFDRYLSSSTTTWVQPDLARLFFFGVSGGSGYSFPLGPGTASVELRVDWAPAPLGVGTDSGVVPLCAAIIAGYGVKIGGEE